jgi:hypothetical protein
MNAVEAHKHALTGTIVDDVVARGDLSKLTPEQRVVHYHNVCASLGLNPSTEPFGYITLNGKLRLYAKRDACDQLRKLNGISVTVVDRTVTGDMLTVHVRAVDKTGRHDEDFGVVSIAGLRGESAANAMMKAVTKAKRRVTLSIAGLGFNEEGELEGLMPLPPSTPNPQFTGTYASPPSDAQRRNPQLGTVPPEIREDPKRQQEQQASAEKAERAATEPYELERGGDEAKDWAGWATSLIRYINAAPDVDTIENWIAANAAELTTLQNANNGIYLNLMARIEHQKAARVENGT